MLLFVREALGRILTDFLNAHRSWRRSIASSRRSIYLPTIMEGERSFAKSPVMLRELEGTVTEEVKAGNNTLLRWSKS